jgi:hypothetical protein
MSKVFSFLEGVKFNPTTGMTIERILDANSTSLVQEPTGLGTANKFQIEFGNAQNTVTDAVMLSSDGILTINETGTYRIKVNLEYGRSGSSGTSFLIFRALVNGTQAGRSIFTKISNANEIQNFSDEAWLTLPAGLTIIYEGMRDSDGNDSGGLIAGIPSVDTNVWNDAPCASLRVERWI